MSASTDRRSDSTAGLRYIVGEIDAALDERRVADAYELARLLNYIRWQITGEDSPAWRGGARTAEE